MCLCCVAREYSTSPYAISSVIIVPLTEISAGRIMALLEILINSDIYNFLHLLHDNDKKGQQVERLILGVF